MVDPDEDLEVGDRQTTARKVVAATVLEPLLKAVEIESDRAIAERLAPGPLFFVGQVEGRGDLVGDVLDGVHDLIAERRLPWIRRVEACELTDIAVDAVGLGDARAVNLENGQSSKGSVRLATQPVVQGDALLVELDPRDREG